MRTAADKFARTLADNKFGAPFNWSPPTGQPNQYDRIITSAKGICTVIRHERYKDKQRDIHFDLVEDLRLNALAFATKTIDFVGILAGTVLIIRDLFNRMLAHPEVLPNIGESTTEIADGITIPNLNNYAQYLDPQCFPKCAIRAQYADILTETALKFIAGHEMGHLLNGHCELRSQNAVNILCLERDDDDKPCGLDNLSLQTLELDADSVGAFWCWRSEYFIHTILPDLISEFPNSRASFEAAYATPAATCSTLLFALGFSDYSMIETTIKTTFWKVSTLRLVFAQCGRVIRSESIPICNLSLGLHRRSLCRSRRICSPLQRKRWR